jgi:dihydroorotate dehydrogenase (fumarate)
MADLTTSFFGLELKSPVVAASSGLTNSVDMIKRMADYGVGAVVLKSIFEEEIQHEINHELSLRNQPGGADDEYYDYFDYIVKDEHLKKYLKLIESAKKAVKVPIVASVNCISSAEWISYASKLEKSGADALELNLFILPSDLAKSGEQNEKFYFETIKKVKEYVSIPVSVKISSHFSSLAKMILDISETGIGGITLFNRFYMPDIDIQKEIAVGSNVISNPLDYLAPLRWVALLHEQAGCPLAITTGVQSSETLVKCLLAGAGAVQVASILYKEGLESIVKLNEGLTTWMAGKGYSSIGEFRGKVSVSGNQSVKTFERVQFMKHFGEYQ